MVDGGPLDGPVALLIFYRPSCQGFKRSSSGSQEGDRGRLSGRGVRSIRERFGSERGASPHGGGPY